MVCTARKGNLRSRSYQPTPDPGIHVTALEKPRPVILATEAQRRRLACRESHSERVEEMSPGKGGPNALCRVAEEGWAPTLPLTLVAVGSHQLLSCPDHLSVERKNKT